MPSVNIELEKAVDNLIECRRKLIEAVTKAGRKEVVDWITAHGIDLSLVSSSHSGLCFSIIEWQAKLKDWGR